MSSKYQYLKKANLSFEYLHSNSTTHEFLFGALAELVDNSRDADANVLKIYTEDRPNLRGGFMLCFLDDGCGMDPADAADVISFGKSNKKKSSKSLIGRYGNGLKSGSMRIGSDLILLTKKNGIYTIILISDTFLRAEKILEIVVPMPSFHVDSKTPWFDKSAINDTKAANLKHKTEMDLIYKYSPIKSMDEMISYMGKIDTSSGTLAIIYNLKMSEGLTELDIESDPEDIQMRNVDVEYDRKSQEEHKSFRKYVSILYSNPRMQIYIQNKKVQTKLLDRMLYWPRMYEYTSSKFKKRAEQEKELAQQEERQAKNELREAESNLAHYENTRNNKNPNDNKNLVEFRRKKEEAEKNYELKKKNVEMKTRDVTNPKKLQFIFGLNINNRNADGLFIYNCNRLIIMFEHTKQQLKNHKEYRGIVGIVNVPYFVSQPTHNKQQFADNNEQRQLVNALSEHMEQYLRDIGKDLDREFWKEFGYFSDRVELPSMEETYIKRRLQYVKPVLQCSRCQKWRILRFHPILLDPSYFSDNWQCSDSTDSTKDNCQEPESLDEYLMGELKKVTPANFNYQEPKTKPSYSSSNKSDGPVSSTTNSVATSSVADKLNFQNKVYAQLLEKEKNHVVNKSTPPSKNNQRSDAFEHVSENEMPYYDQASASSKTGIKRTSEPLTKKRVRTRNESDDENDPDFVINNRQLNQNAKKPNGTYTTNSKLSTGSGITITHNVPTVGIKHENAIENVLFNEIQADNQMNFADLQVDSSEVSVKKEVEFIPDNNCLTSFSLLNNGNNTMIDPNFENGAYQFNNLIYNKYRDLLIMMASVNSQTKAEVAVIENLTNDQLMEFSVNDLYAKFRDNSIRQTRKQLSKQKEKYREKIKSFFQIHGNKNLEEALLQEIDKI